MAQRPTFFQRPDRITEPLQVATSYFNSPRFRTRMKLYEDFAFMVKEADANLWTVEIAFGDREFVIPVDPEHPERLLRLRTDNELWFKENAINLLVAWMTSHEPDWKYMANLDGDIKFVRGDWDDEIVQKLQHYPVLQPWTQALDLSSEYEVVGGIQRSIGWAVVNEMPILPTQYYYYGGAPGAKFYHPGYAWAMRREAWDGLGGLLDIAILGSADNYMAQAMLGQVEIIIPAGVSDRYRALIMEWQERAKAVIKRNIGCTDGLILHHWHGPKAARLYTSRNQILIDTHFNPDTDLRRDAQGLWQLSHRNDARSRSLRDQVRNYFHNRRDDDPTPPDLR